MKNTMFNSTPKQNVYSWNFVSIARQSLLSCTQFLLDSINKISGKFKNQVGT